MNRPVPFLKAVSIVFAGFLSGFCAVAAYLSYSDGHMLTSATLGYIAGAILALAGAVVINRFL